jgi:hypothetical protein
VPIRQSFALLDIRDAAVSRAADSGAWRDAARCFMYEVIVSPRKKEVAESNGAAFRRPQVGTSATFVEGLHRT